jgi:hypothetical protein
LFAEVWQEVRSLLETNPGPEAKTVFEHLQRGYPARFADGQLRTLQRRVKVWRATEGPAKEVFFAQQHVPGELSASDFTHIGLILVEKTRGSVGTAPAFAARPSLPYRLERARVVR